MQKLFVLKENKIIIDSCEANDFEIIQENHYPKIISKNMSFPDWMIDVLNIENIPDEVIPYKYCYTSEQGFYINPDWVEPDETNVYGVPDEVYHQIIDDYTLELVGGAVNE